MVKHNEIIEHASDNYYVLRFEYIEDTLDQYPSKSACIKDFESEYGTEEEYIKEHYDEVREELEENESATEAETRWECDNER